MILQQLLVEIYSDYGEQQCIRPEGNREFRLESDSVFEAPYAHCSIRVTLPDLESDHFRLTHFPVPWDDGVAALAKKLGGDVGEFSPGRILELPMTVSSVPDIRRLARSIRKVVGKGKKYPNPNWEWVAKKTADSLDRFAGLLSTWIRIGRWRVPEEIPF